MPAKTAKKTVAKAKKAAMKKVGAKKPNWNQLTPRQQAQLKKQYAAALAEARKDIAAGGYTLLSKTKDGVEVYAANDALTLHITPKCVKNACRSSKEDCVIARAIKQQQPFATGWQVGTNITMIYCDKAKQVIRYGTSSKLAKALAHYDKTGVWLLVPGHYRLNPLPAAYRVGTRWAWHKGSGGKRSTFKGMKQPATRRGTYRAAVKKAA